MQASPEMQKVIGELATKHGVDLTVVGAWMRLELPHFDRLVVECIGVNRVSVAHYYESFGDLVTCPEIVFAVENGQWFAISYETGGVGYDVFARKSNGAWLYKPDAQKGAATFADEWAGNIRSQGWIEQGELTRVDRGDGRKAA